MDESREIGGKQNCISFVYVQNGSHCVRVQGRPHHDYGIEYHELSPRPKQTILRSRTVRRRGRGRECEMHLLCDQKDVNRTQVKLVIERQSGQTIICRVYTSIQHDRLALVLNDVTRSSNLISTAQAQEHQLIGRINRLFILGRRRVEFPFRSHRVNVLPLQDVQG